MIRFLLTFLIFCLFMPVQVFAVEEISGDLMTEVEALVIAGPNVDPDRYNAVAEQVRSNPADVVKRLLPKLSDPTLSENQFVVYLWALGLTKDPVIVSVVQTLFNETGSTIVKSGCLRALAEVGGPKVEDILLDVLANSSSEEEHFAVLNFLGQMQSVKALSVAEGLLEKDPRQFYWQNILFFGKMGDQGVPFLLDRLGSEDLNVRINVANVLGHWLLAKPAIEPIINRYWEETDPELKLIYLGAVERSSFKFEPLEEFFQEVVTKETDPELKTFASETVDSVSSIQNAVREYRAAKQIDPQLLQMEYDKLFRTYGLEGDYEILDVYSTVTDEPKLKALREQILRRDSDEAFYDYQRVNEVLIKNRLADSLGSR